MRKIIIVIFLLSFTFISVESYACHTNEKCVCNCNNKCKCGEYCKEVRFCNLIENCKGPCTWDKEKLKCDNSKELVCHIPKGNSQNSHTLCISKNSLKAHLKKHGGDYIGYCNKCETNCSVKLCCKTIKKCECMKCSSKCKPCECKPKCGDGECNNNDNESCLLCPEDCGNCCGNNECEPWENCKNCSKDCGKCSPVCGDNKCESGETCNNCLEDCGPCPPVCGDNNCEVGENCNNCSEDCGLCPPSCGNNICEFGETCKTCERDCGKCPSECGNGVCENKETCKTCERDCGKCPSECGDGVCEGKETCKTCEKDCGKCPSLCGNNICESGETCKTCEKDCGKCPSKCGDGVCEVEETCKTCERDCGKCPSECGNGVCEKGENCTLCPKDCGECINDSGVIKTDSQCNCPDGFVEEGKDAGINLNEYEYTGGGGCSINNGSNISSSIVFIIFFIGLLLKRKLVIFLLLFIPSISIAQNTRDYIITSSAKVLPHLKPSIGLWYQYTDMPSQLINKKTGKHFSKIDEFNHKLELVGKLGLINILDVGITLPFIPYQKMTGLKLVDPLLNNNDRTDGGFGDVGVFVKGNVYNYKKLSIGLSLFGTLPTSTNKEILGETGPTIMPMGLFEWDDKYIDFSTNVGFKFRYDQGFNIGEQKVNKDGEFIWTFGLKVPVWKDRLDILGDIQVSTVDGKEVPVIGFCGFRNYLPFGFSFDAGIGIGLTQEIGTPNYLVYTGITWTPKKEVEIRIVKEKCKDCPEQIVCPKCKKVVVERDEVYLAPVYFATDKDYILPQSSVVLDKAVETLLKFTFIKKVVLEGHCDWRSGDTYNMNLGMRRARFVYNYLINNGVSPSRLETISFGESKPFNTNTTKDGMSRNRRVEFKIKELNK